MSRCPPPLYVLFFIAFNLSAQTPAQEIRAPGTLRIRPLEGDGAINSIRLHRAYDPVVQVLDAGGEPVAGAAVAFVLPASGPGGTFPDNGLTLTSQTDAKGIARSRGLRPNDTPGQFQIRVTASWRAASASATLTQTNAEPAAGSGKTKKILIVGLVGGAVVGVVLGVAAGGSGSSQAAGSTGTANGGAAIVSGAPSIGPPH
jgi:hypothetical protein